MEKPTRKIQTVLLGTILVLVIIFMNSNIFGTGGETRNADEEGREYGELEQALMNTKGVGEVVLYFHTEKSEEANALSDYFSLSTTQVEKSAGHMQGVLVVAEGAEDPRIRSELSKILSAVLQLPEHRIVIVEMKKKGEHE